jgi:GNAT superfamily N-acetyltransferase
MSEVEIKRAHASDAAIFALLGRITFAETFCHLFVRHETDLQDYLARTFGVAEIEGSLNKDTNVYWLAEWDRLPVGYAKLKFGSRPPGMLSEPFDQLQKIYVLRSFLGRRVGAALMHPIMSEARTRGTNLWLDALRENTHAIAFYERFGFRALGNDTYTIGAQTFRFRLMGATP